MINLLAADGNIHEKERMAIDSLAKKEGMPTPMVGGLISSTLLTLLIIPAVYMIWKGFHIRRALR